MKDTVEILGQSIPYQIKKSHRSRRMRLEYDPHEGVIVTLPYYIPYKAGQIFLYRETGWVENRIKHFTKFGVPAKLKGTTAEYQKYKHAARKLVISRLEHYNKLYKLKYNKIFIRNSSTRWGSASSKANLNFHYKLALIDPKLADYVIVHELCHLKEMNHSKKFWNLVALSIPDFKTRKKHLGKVKLIF